MIFSISNYLIKLIQLNDSIALTRTIIIITMIYQMMKIYMVLLLLLLLLIMLFRIRNYFIYLKIYNTLVIEYYISLGK